MFPTWPRVAPTRLISQIKVPAPEGRRILGPGTIRLTASRLEGSTPEGRGIYPLRFKRASLVMP